MCLEVDGEAVQTRTEESNLRGWAVALSPLGCRGAFCAPLVSYVCGVGWAGEDLSFIPALPLAHLQVSEHPFGGGGLRGLQSLSAARGGRKAEGGLPACQPGCLLLCQCLSHSGPGLLLPPGGLVSGGAGSSGGRGQGHSC